MLNRSENDFSKKFSLKPDLNYSPVDSSMRIHPSRLDAQALQCSDKGMTFHTKADIRQNKYSDDATRSKTAVSATTRGQFTPAVSAPESFSSLIESTRSSMRSYTPRHETALKPKEIDYKGISLVPEDKKIALGASTFSFNPTLTTFNASCHNNQGPNKFDMGCQAQGSLLDLDMSVNTSLGKLKHRVTFGEVDVSVGLRSNRDLGDARGGFGGHAKGKIDLINTYYGYDSPVVCKNGTGFELKAEASVRWGWEKNNELDLSLTTATLPFKGISQPIGWAGTQLNMDGEIKIIRTPDHPECKSQRQGEAISPMNTAEKEHTSHWNNKINSGFRQNPEPTFHHKGSKGPFFDTKNNLNSSSVNTTSPSFDSTRLRLNEPTHRPLGKNYQAGENKKSVPFLSGSTETCLLQTNYVSPEAQVVAMSLAKPGRNPSGFFNAGKKDDQVNSNYTSPFNKNVTLHGEQSNLESIFKK